MDIFIVCENKTQLYDDDDDDDDDATKLSCISRIIMITIMIMIILCLNEMTNSLLSPSSSLSDTLLPSCSFYFLPSSTDRSDAK